jgi:hypothetical protein
MVMFIQMFRQCGYRLPRSEFLATVYGGTAAESPLRRLLVDLYIRRHERDRLMSKIRAWPSEFLLGLAAKMLLQTDCVSFQSTTAEDYLEPEDEMA